MNAPGLDLIGAGVGVVASAALVVSATFGRRSEKTAAELRSALWHAENIDPMTGLRNRRALLAEMAARQAHGRPWSLVRFDADQFKQVNDTYGHATGDLVLCDLARRLEIGAGEHGVAARLHGDEYAMVVPYAAEVAVELMERVADLTAMPMRLDCGVRLVVRTSIGLVDGDSDPDAEVLMDRADKAVYVSKLHGHPVVWRPDFRRWVEQEMPQDAAGFTLDLTSAMFAGGGAR